MNKPEIRIKGFEGEWGKLLFSFVAKLSRGLTYSPDNITTNGIRVLRSSNINEDTFIISENDVFVNPQCVNIPLASDGDILITAANGSPRLVGKHAIIKKDKNEKFVPGGFMLVASTDEPDFVNACMGGKWYKKFLRTGVSGGNGAIGNLNKQELENFDIYIPQDKKERIYISVFFRSFDFLIHSTAKKIASLKQIKAASLQSMFPQNGETKPKVRFKGFEEEWEICKLSDIARRVTRKNTNLESKLPLTISSIDGLVSQINYFNNIVASSNLRGYYLIKNGEFAYNKSYSNGYPWGSVKRLDRYENGALSTLYIVFEIKGNISSDYLTHFFDTSLWHKDVSERAAEGARNHGLLNISADDFLDIQIIYPNNISEQQKIASYFRSLDNQISLQEKRLEKLKQIKSTCLDKMFV